MRFFFVGRLTTLIAGTLFLLSCVVTKNMTKSKTAKDIHYVVINDEAQTKAERSVLTKPASLVPFPLSEEDQKIVDLLEEKFDSEQNCAGLAAPQIGFLKQIIILSVPDDPKLKKWRRDLSQSMPKTIWLNPSYEAMDDEMHEDLEACFSVHDLAGPVKRHKKIRYFAYLKDGTKVSGTASGYLARLIQHEVDHLRGVLFISRVEEERLFSLGEYLEKRRARMESDDS